MFSKQPWMYNSSTDFYDFNIDNSLIFDKDSSNKLSFTQGTPTDISKWTVNFWFKTTEHTATFANDYVTLWSVEGPGTTSFSFIEGDIHFYLNYNSSGSQLVLKSNAKFRDPSAWYNFHVKYDRDNSTVAEKLKIFVNGTDLDSFGGWQTDGRSNIASNTSTGWNVNSAVAGIGGRISTSSRYFSGYLSQFYNIDGQALNPSSFAELKDNIWKPKEYTGTFGNNGWLLEFKQTGTGTGSTTTVGADTSGRGNHFDSTNIVSSDVVSDSPTNNFATMNFLDDSNMNYSEGSLRPTPSADYKATRGTIGIPTSGKWYFEARVITGGGGNVQDQMIGVATSSNVLTGTSPYPQAFTHGVGYIGPGQINRAGSANQTSLTALSAGTIVGVAVDVDNNQVQFYLNGSAEGTAKQLVSTSEPNFPMFVGATNRSSQFNFGQDSTFAGAISAGGNADANGNGDFAYAPPSDHLALCTSNLSDPAIDPNSEENPTDHFNTVLYTGDGQTTKSVTVGFEPDFTWIKSRSTTGHHSLIDSVRGDIAINSNQAIAEYGVTPFNSNSNGTIDVPYYNNAYSMNTNSTTYVAWNWLGGGAASTNNNGAIQSSVSANTKAGFSIVSYTGTGSASTVGHGLTQAPELILVKNRDDATKNWNVYATILGNNYLELNNSIVTFTGANYFNNTLSTNTVFSVGSLGSTNGNGNGMIAYCFHSVDGFSKVGRYISNNSADGPFSYTGFRPAFLLIKRTQSASANWLIYDDKRDIYNQMQFPLFPNTDAAEYTSNLLHVDFLSNGFKIRNATYGETNAPSGHVYLYMAFAKQPFKYANAR